MIAWLRGRSVWVRGLIQYKIGRQGEKIVVKKGEEAPMNNLE